MQTIAELVDIAKELRCVERDLQEAQKVASTIKFLQEHFRTLQNQLVKKLDEMDCKSSGNFGYENRITSLLIGLDAAYRQGEQKGK